MGDYMLLTSVACIFSRGYGNVIGSVIILLLCCYCCSKLLAAAYRWYLFDASIEC